MNGLEKQFAELLSLTQLYLLHNYQIKDRIFAETESYQHFKEHIQEIQTKPRPSPAIVPQPLPIPPKTSITLPPEPKKAPVPPVFEKRISAPPQPQAMALDKPPETKPDSFETMRALYKQLMPHKVIIDKIPDDSEAIKQSSLWKQKKDCAVAILSFNESTNHRNFLQNLARAIESLNISAEVFKAESLEISKEMRLMIAPEKLFRDSPKLMQTFRETPAGYFLEHIPLLLVPEIEVYLKDAKQKSLLWNRLKDILTPQKT